MLRNAGSFRAPIAGALLFFGCLLLLPARGGGGCDLQPGTAREIHRVSWVYDGDTVRLKDGRRLRLIGLNAPEMGRDGQPGEPFSNQARQRLKQLLASSDYVAAPVLGVEKNDRYGRFLGHLYLPDGTNLAAELLAEGLAVAAVVPPNLSQLDCYLDAESRARAKRRGLWRESPVLAEESLSPKDRGFRIVRGRVERLSRSEEAFWVTLAGGLVLRVGIEDIQYFPGVDFSKLPGRELEVRGWISERKGKLRMKVRHRAALRWIQGD